MISVIAPFAEDTIINHETGSRYTQLGGPALWIRNALIDLQVPYQLISGSVPARVEIVTGNNEEKGCIREKANINLGEEIKAMFHLISTIGNDFDLSKIIFLKGKVILDVQGYVRSSNRHLQQLASTQCKQIHVVKGTEQEIERVDKQFIEQQKSKLLILTKGNAGFDMYYRNNLYIFHAQPIVAPDTIGAGDTFLAAFSAYYYRSYNPYFAATNAQKYVEDFLKNKIY